MGIGLRKALSLTAGALLAASLALTGGTASADFPPGTLDVDLPVGVAWGGNGGFLGSDSNADAPAPILIDGGTELDHREMASVHLGKSATEMSCALTEGQVACWNFGDGHPKPTIVDGSLHGKNVDYVAVGRNRACAVAENRVYCWLDKALNPVLAPLGEVGARRTITAITVGADHQCVIAANRAFCWGNGVSGRLGTGTEASADAPKAVVDTYGPLQGYPVDAISAGATHTCAIAGGKVSCWGVGSVGQLGTGNTMKALVPTAVNTTGVLKNLTVKAISAGTESTTCVIAGAGSARRAYCWGAGPLGNGTSGNSNLPVAVDTAGIPSKSIDAIAAGDASGCVIAADSPFCWGADAKITGNGSPGAALVPEATKPNGVLTSFDGETIDSVRTMITISAAKSAAAGVANTVKPIADVTEISSAIHDARWSVASGLQHLSNNGTMSATASVRRDQMALYLFRFYNPGQVEPKCSEFEVVYLDLFWNHEWCGAIKWAKKEGIVAAVDNYHPTDVVDRGSAAAFLYRAHHRFVGDAPCAGNIISDVKITTPNCGDIEWLVRAGLSSANPYHPSAPLTLLDVATLFHRLSGITTY